MKRKKLRHSEKGSALISTVPSEYFPEARPYCDSYCQTSTSCCIIINKQNNHTLSKPLLPVINWPKSYCESSGETSGRQQHCN